MKDGAECRATTIVSDVGLGTTLGPLLSESFVAVHALVDRVEQIGPSLAHLCLYVGVSTARLAGPLNAANLVSNVIASGLHSTVTPWARCGGTRPARPNEPSGQMLEQELHRAGRASGCA